MSLSDRERAEGFRGCRCSSVIGERAEGFRGVGVLLLSESAATVFEAVFVS